MCIEHLAVDGNLIGNNDSNRYDTSQVPGGKVTDTYAGAVALLGSQQITQIDLVVDAGWKFAPQVQTVLVRNVQVNDQTFFAPSTSSSNAAKTCRAEEHSLGTSGFEQKWGSNHNLHNAFGKCVSKTAHMHSHS